jgi:predicted small metal-binding protein
VAVAGAAVESAPVRAVRCWCGELVVADDETALARELAEHAREAHPEDQRDEAAVRAFVAERAEDAPDRPPWAY